LESIFEKHLESEFNHLDILFIIPNIAVIVITCVTVTKFVSK